MKLKRLSLFLALVMILSAFAGTFTFASAATAGGTFTINGGDPITGQIATQNLKDGDVIVLQSDYVVTATENGSFIPGITINGDSNGDGKADHTVTLAARWFNWGWSTKPADNANANYNVSFSGKVLTFKNLNMVSQAGCGSIIQSQNKDATIVVDNCVIENYSKDGRGFTMANGANQTITFTNNKVTTYSSANAGNGFIFAATESDIVNVTDCEFVSAGFKSGGSNWGCFIFASGKNNKVNMTRVSMDGSAAQYHRLAYTNGGGTPVWTIKDSIFVGSSNSHDVFQVTAATNMSFEDVVFMGGGSHSTGDIIIRNASGTGAIGYYSSSDSYNQIKVVARSSKYATDADLLKHFGKDPTVTGTNYDAAAQSMGYVARLTDAATAYANGKFSGYYSCIKDALDAMGTTITANKELVILNDISWETTLTVNMQNANSKFNITGVQRADGSYPTIWGFNSLLTFTYGKADGEYTNNDTVIATPGTNIIAGNLGTTTVKNLNIIATAANITQINTGTLIFENCHIDQRSTSYGIILNGTNAKAYQTDANRIAGAEIYGAKLKLVNTTIEQTSGTVSPLRFNADIAYVDMINSKLIPLAGVAPVQIVEDGVLNYDAASEAGDVTTYNFSNNQYLKVNGVAYSAPTMKTGASVRIAKGATAENLVESGIRFESTLSAKIMAAVNESLEGDALENAKVGTVVFKYEDLGSMSIAELVAAANADANDDLIVADIEAKNGIVKDEKGNVTIRAAIVNVKEKNYDVAFGAVAYIEYETAEGETVRLYGKFDATNNVRSIKGVAEAALADTKTALEIEANGGATFGNWTYANQVGTTKVEVKVPVEGGAEGETQTQEIEVAVFSCYTDEQIAILNTYAGK